MRAAVAGAIGHIPDAHKVKNVKLVHEITDEVVTKMLVDPKKEINPVVKKINEKAKSDQNDDNMRAAVAGAIGVIPDAHKAKQRKRIHEAKEKATNQDSSDSDTNE